MAEFISEKNIKTRKKHQCFGCLDTYPAGENMRRHVCTDNGKIYSLYFCEECNEIIANNADYFEDFLYPDEKQEGFVHEFKMQYPEKSVNHPGDANEMKKEK
jgi:hypothetical protein